MDLYMALNVAQQMQSRPDVQNLARELCAVRGQDPERHMFVVGLTIPRWVAAIAELLMLGRIQP